MSDWIPADEWETIIRNVPVVSVDLLVECPNGLVLGKRVNAPAQGTWFVPGGRLHKGEHLPTAVSRVAAEELSVEVEMKQHLGVFEHFYNKSEIGGSKHYIANGFHVWTDETQFQHDTQHSSIETFIDLPDDTHEYVLEYIREADTGWQYYPP